MILRDRLSLCVAIACTILSCQDHGAELVEEGGPGLIVPGKSIEGIKLGDSKEAVDAKLGWHASGGIADGGHRSWLARDFRTGELAGFSILFIENGRKHGPVDVLIVTAPYKGKTKEGIGVGAALSTVRQTYGAPQRSRRLPDRNWIVDHFCFDRRELEVHYVDDIVTGMSIEYFIPMAHDTLCN